MTVLLLYSRGKFSQKHPIVISPFINTLQIGGPDGGPAVLKSQVALLGCGTPVSVTVMPLLCIIARTSAGENDNAAGGLNAGTTVVRWSRDALDTVNNVGPMVVENCICIQFLNRLYNMAGEVAP